MTTTLNTHNYIKITSVFDYTLIIGKTNKITNEEKYSDLIQC